MYFDLEEKFEVLPEAHFSHAIYCFEAQEVKSPTLEMVCKSELKWSYGHLKTIAQSWKTISEIQLMNSKSNSKWP